MSKIKAYKEILKVLEKHTDSLDGYRYYRLVQDIKQQLECAELQELFGIPIPDYAAGTKHYQLPSMNERIGQYITYFGEECYRSISWSDDDRQPKNEWLYQITFPCGEYTFHQGYPVETFKAFFDELKAFGPKYCDTANKCLYFTPEKAAEVYSQFKAIFKKHSDRVQGELKRKKMEALQAELDSLKEGEV